ATSVRCAVPVADLRHIDGAVRGEVPTHDQVDDVVVRLVGAGDPPSTVHHSRIHEIADLVVQQRLGADVAKDQEGVGGKVRLVEDRHLGGFQRGLQTLEVHLAVSGDTDRQE